MTSRDFCYWLQGYFEINAVDGDTLSDEQVARIRKHLNLVFVHEIDPSAGPPAHQAELNAIHNGTKTELADAKAAIETLQKQVEALRLRPTSSGSPVMRC
jgi:hypothetical protein